MSWFLWPRLRGHFQRKGLSAHRVESGEARLARRPLLRGFGVTLCWCLLRCSNLQVQWSTYWESSSLSQGLFLFTQVMEIPMQPGAWACLQADLARGKLDFTGKLVWGAWLQARPVTDSLSAATAGISVSFFSSAAHLSMPGSPICSVIPENYNGKHNFSLSYPRQVARCSPSCLEGCCWHLALKLSFF